MGYSFLFPPLCERKKALTLRVAMRFKNNMLGVYVQGEVKLVNSESSILLVVSLSMGALCIALAIPLIGRRIPPNHWYGLRVPATFADERIWYEANARAGKELLALGIFIIAIGALLYAITIPSWLSVALWFAFIMGSVILFVVRSWRFANRLLEHYRSETESTPPNKPLQRTR
ncbi:MAG: SdpI family protein [Calditrichaeota bacterium]|nr:MAG: SdpI family protein [Calditrichota bacterium]